MSKNEWAAKEVELLCKRVGDGYTTMCAKAALEAFNFIANQGHSGCSIEVTKSILFDLLDERPLIFIQGLDDEWVWVYNKEGSKIYQNLRRSSLFKTAYSDGTIEYKDNNTSYCVNKNGGPSYNNTFIQQEAIKALSAQGIDDYCVTFPYLPPREKLEIVVEECMYDKKQMGDFDTIGILYANVPKRGKVNINRFYKETEKGFESITEGEWDIRTSDWKEA